MNSMLAICAYLLFNYENLKKKKIYEVSLPNPNYFVPQECNLKTYMYCTFLNYFSPKVASFATRM